MSAYDLYGNEVGDMAIVSAADAKITISGYGDAACMNMNIQYQQPIQPVATFGKDVIFARGVAQGQFTVGALAGTTSFANGANSCAGKDINVNFGVTTKCNVKINGQTLKPMSVKMHGGFFNGFGIQGTAQDYFFTQSVSGFFHYLTA